MDNNNGLRRPEEIKQHPSLVSSTIEYFQHEAVLAIGALPLVLSHFGPIVRAFEFGGWADTFVDAWAPIMSAIAQGISWVAAQVLPFPISPPFVPLVAVIVQLSAVLVFAFRRFGYVPYFAQAFAKFGLPRTIGHYAVHLAASVLLVMFIARASGIPLEQFVEGPFNALGLNIAWMGVNCVDRGVTLLASSLVIVLFLWHPGVGVRLLALLLVMLAFDYATGLVESTLTGGIRAT